MKTFLVLSITLISGTVYSQIEINPVIGINEYRLSSDPSFYGHPKNEYYSQEMNADFVFGINGRFGDKIFFNPGIQFISQASNIYAPHYAVEQQDRIEITYQSLRIPLMAGWKFYQFNENCIILKLGFAPLILLHASDRNDNMFYPSRKEFYNTFNVGLTGGLGFDIHSFTIDLLFEHGLHNAYSSNVPLAGEGYTISPGSNTGYPNRYTGNPLAAYLTMGWKFGL